jgi:hypothetical protein
VRVRLISRRTASVEFHLEVGDGLIEAFGLHVDAMYDAFRSRVGDPASRGEHRQEYIAISLFVLSRPGVDPFENGYNNGYSHKIKGRSGQAGRPIGRS